MAEPLLEEGSGFGLLKQPIFSQFGGSFRGSFQAILFSAWFAF